ncbi:hypothetical protein [Microcoleus sp. S13C4]|uniref:hypothetical protein n=1 Tax=Microcoleus sp. S13C4 TaxID=3055410 RepID=UPI002FCF8DFF
MAASLHHHQKISKKPGFWALRAIEYNQFKKFDRSRDRGKCLSLSFDAKIENSS